jgi:hypothetical protein
MFGHLSSGGDNPDVPRARILAVVACVILVLFSGLLRAGAVDGTCTVSESWLVTIQQGAQPPITYRGRETGTLTVNNNTFTPLDHTGIPTGDTNLNVRTIAGSGPYSILGDNVYAGYGIATNGLVDIIHLTFFSIGIPFGTPLDGTVNPSKTTVFSALGPSLTGFSGSGKEDNGDHYFITAQTSSSLTQIGPPPAPVPFLTGEAFLGNSVYYLAFTNGNTFGYYSTLYYPYVYHYDLGWEYFIDAQNANHGVYMYDFLSSTFFYTDPTLFPYLYDFTLNSWLYYYADTGNAGHYTTNPRYFFNFGTGKIITK